MRPIIFGYMIITFHKITDTQHITILLRPILYKILSSCSNRFKLSSNTIPFFSGHFGANNYCSICVRSHGPIALEA